MAPPLRHNRDILYLLHKLTLKSFGSSGRLCPLIELVDAHTAEITWKNIRRIHKHLWTCDFKMCQRVLGYVIDSSEKSSFSVTSAIARKTGARQRYRLSAQSLHKSVVI